MVRCGMWEEGCGRSFRHHCVSIFPFKAILMDDRDVVLNMNVNIDCFLFSEMKLSYSMSLKCYNRRRHCIVGELSLWKLQNNFEIFPLTILTRLVVSDAT